MVCDAAQVGQSQCGDRGMFLGWRLLVLAINVTSALLSMVFLGGVLYIGYRFLIAPTSDKDAGQ
ncbi:MAG: hypothetical protein HC925_01940 [Coleofasciculaceae cyanobacterium SM2_3_26]|nr:hypothetical protein [Coleofasciculaceae cyanobacterium SM2_3_26]